MSFELLIFNLKFKAHSFFFPVPDLTQRAYCLLIFLITARKS